MRGSENVLIKYYKGKRNFEVEGQYLTDKKIK